MAYIDVSAPTPPSAMPATTSHTTCCLVTSVEYTMVTPHRKFRLCHARPAQSADAHAVIGQRPEVWLQCGGQGGVQPERQVGDPAPSLHRDGSVEPGQRYMGDRKPRGLLYMEVQGKK